MAGTAMRIGVAGFASQHPDCNEPPPQRGVTGVIAGTGRQPLPCGETGTGMLQEPRSLDDRLER